MKKKIFSVLFALVLAVSLMLVPATVSADHGAVHPTVDRCEGIIDLSTGTTDNFIAQSPGTPEDAQSDPLDWEIEETAAYSTAYAVNAYPGWYAGPEVGTIANWITPFTGADRKSARGSGDFNATMTFSALSSGVITLYVTADDGVEIYLDGGLIGDHTTYAAFRTLKKITANVTPGSHTIKAVVEDTYGVVSGLLVIGRYCPSIIDIDIDIKPGSDPNGINPKSRGVIPVAILTTADFDAATVDPNTVLFGPTGTEAAPVHYALEDVDDDGDIDMILHFKTQDTGIASGDTSATLTGLSITGQPIVGTDSVKTAGK